MPETTFDERMAGHIASLSAALDQERAAVVDLRARLQESEGNCERLQNALAALGSKPERKKSGPKIAKREMGTSTGFGISLERVKPIHDRILEVVDGGAATVTQKEIYKPLDLDQTVGSASFQFLRSIGFLRLAGRDASRKRDLWAIMDRDAFTKVWAETFERDPEADAQALRKRLRDGFEGEPDRLDLVAAYIRDRKEVRGWATIADDLDIPRHTVEDMKATLANTGVIEVDTQRGRPSIIRWVAGNTTIKEVLNGAA